MVYPWTRYWLRADETTDFNEPFLYLPEERYAYLYGTKATSLGQLEEPCVLLLGEPSMGKTTALKAFAEQADNTLYRDLKLVGSLQSLGTTVFANSEFRSLLTSKQPFTLLLDSLDEAKLEGIESSLLDAFNRHLLVAELTQKEAKAFFSKYPDQIESSDAGDEASSLVKVPIPELSDVDADGLTWLRERSPIARVRLRIACRTAELPRHFTKSLDDMFGVEEYTLAPLQRQDVIKAAEMEGLNPQEFFEEVDRQDVAYLAANPVTLKLLLHEFKRNATLPERQGDLFDQGCLRLCNELSDDRHDTDQIGAHTPEESLIAATRIAALLVLSDSDAVFMGADELDKSQGDIALSVIYSKADQMRADGVTRSVTKETLRRGLFVQRGARRRGFIHRRFGEYLAAKFLAFQLEEIASVDKVMSVLVHPVDGRILPRLYETVGFLASLSEPIFDLVLDRDPEVLIGSDLRIHSEDRRKRLVQSLLKHYEAGTRVELNSGAHLAYWKLDHPDLKDQLKPYIEDRKKNELARRFAIFAAQGCNLSSLGDTLADRALDPSEAEYIRNFAGVAVRDIATEEVKARLLPLARGERGDDPDDQLKGIALQAVFPEHMNAEALFDLLTPPKRSNLYGNYRSFLGIGLSGDEEGFAQHLTSRDLPRALDWMFEQENPNARGPGGLLSVAADVIMYKAWENFDDPAISSRFARNAINRLSKHVNIVGVDQQSLEEQFRNDLTNTERRQKLLREMLAFFVQADHKKYTWLTYRDPKLVRAEDARLLADVIRVAEDDTEREVATALLLRVIRWDNPDERDLALTLACEVPLFATKANLAAVDLNSDTAKQTREAFYKRLERDKESSTEEDIPVPDPEVLVLHALEQFEAGNLAFWFDVTENLTLAPGDTHYRHALSVDVNNFPGWQEAPDTLKARILSAAKRFLEEAEPAIETRELSGSIYLKDYAGYRALRLLLDEGVEALERLPESIWRKWAPTVVAYPITPGEDEALHQSFLKIVYKLAPDDVIRMVRKLVDRDNAVHQTVFITQKLGPIWDEKLTEALEDKVQETALEPGSKKVLLDLLLARGSEKAYRYALSLIKNGREENRALAVKAATALYGVVTSERWDEYWEALIEGVSFAEDATVSIAVDFKRSAVAERLAEEQVEQLYTWLVEHFPHSKDPQKPDHVYSPSPRMSLSQFRDGLLAELEGWGTFEACDAINRIKETFPHLDWLVWTLHQAQQITRQKTSPWLEPSELAELFARTESRLVRNGADLRRLLLEQLANLEADLQYRDTPGAQFLWNDPKEKEEGRRGKRKYYEPKDENSFSNWIKRFLEDRLVGRGIVFGREVEISPGQETDIHVTAFTKSGRGEVSNPVKVIIEVKGSWHNEVKTAMKTQLVEDYLNKSDCNQGIYLVGWYNCDIWQGGPLKTWGIEEAKHFLKTQAMQLSKNLVRVEAVVIDATYPANRNLRRKYSGNQV